MPEEKEYGYARDLDDIDNVDPDSNHIPADVTENYITFMKSNHFAKNHSITMLIFNHDMIVDADDDGSIYIDHGYEEFDAAARQAVAETINPPETDEEDQTPPDTNEEQ